MVLNIYLILGNLMHTVHSSNWLTAAYISKREGIYEIYWSGDITLNNFL